MILFKIEIAHHGETEGRVTRIYYIIAPDDESAENMLKKKWEKDQTFYVGSYIKKITQVASGGKYGNLLFKRDEK